MNKRLVFSFGGLIFGIILIFIWVVVNDNHLHEMEDLMPPDQISSYQERGYFTIDPETVLFSLESGDTNVFIPASRDDTLDRKELTDNSIYWTQVDFLKIATAVGQYAWDDTMDLRNWSLFSVSFMGHCDDALGFDYASISYFKTVGSGYLTRFIEIDPRFGLVKWGDGQTYPQPILNKWESVNLPEAKITADEALQTVIDDVKANTETKDNICGVVMRASRYDPQNWHVQILKGSLGSNIYSVDFDTGDYTAEVVKLQSE